MNKLSTHINELTSKMRVDIPKEIEEYHTAIMKLHTYLNDLTDLFAEVSNEILSNRDNKEYCRDLKMTLEVIKDRKSQLSQTKQFFNMIINKGSKYEFPNGGVGSRGKNNKQNIPVQEDIDIGQESVVVSKEDLTEDLNNLLT